MDVRRLVHVKAAGRYHRVGRLRIANLRVCQRTPPIRMARKKSPSLLRTKRLVHGKTKLDQKRRPFLETEAVGAVGCRLRQRLSRAIGPSCLWLRDG